MFGASLTVHQMKRACVDREVIASRNPHWFHSSLRPQKIHTLVSALAPEPLVISYVTRVPGASFVLLL